MPTPAPNPPASRRTTTQRPERARGLPPLRDVRVGPVVKRSVSLDAEIDSELTRRFGPGGKSRFLNDAARDALARLRITELLARYDSEDGPVAAEIHEQVAQLPRPR